MKNKILNFLRAHRTLIIILTIAALLRLIAIFKNGDFWMDEMFSFVYSQKSWADSLHFWTWETNPPLFTFILKLWFSILPATEFFARLPSLLFGTAAVGFVYATAKRLFGARSAVLTGLILALSPMANLYSATARSYSLLILLVAISYYFFFRIFFLFENTRRLKILYAISSLLLIYTHLTALAIFFGQFIIIIAAQRESIRRFIKINILPALLFLIWFIPSTLQKISENSLSNTWYFNLDSSLTAKIKGLSVFAFGPMKFLGIIFWLIFIGLIIYLFIKKDSTRRDPNFLAVLACLFIPLSTALFLNLHEIKFLVNALPPFALALGYVIDLFFENRLALIAPFVFLPGVFGIYSLLPIDNWQPVCDFLRQNYSATKKQVFLYDNFTNKNQIDFYCHPAIYSVGFLPIPAPDWDKFLITKNYFRFAPNYALLNNFVKKYSTDNDEIFLLQHPANAFINYNIASLLEKNGYKQKTEPIKQRILNAPNLYYYVK